MDETEELGALQKPQIMSNGGIRNRNIILDLMF